MKKNIIIVGDYCRKDFLYVAEVLHKQCNITFIEYTHSSEVVSDHYKNFGNAIFWGDYKSAITLLEDINPKIVLFFFIESFNHVALNIACKYKGIKTYHIEHGIRNYEMLRANVNNIPDHKTLSINLSLCKWKSFIYRLKGRLFYKNTSKLLPKEYKLFLKEYFQIRSSKTVFQTFKEINNKLRLADIYISFSPRIFEFHQKSDHLPKDFPVHFVGCPTFDYLAKNLNVHSIGNNILFIDNAFETQNLFGWNEEIKIQFLQQLVDFSTMQNKTLWIKPHPYANQKVYTHAKERSNVAIIDNDLSLIAAIKDCKIILGFYSTLLMPLMALKRTVCFALEMHPAILEKEPSFFLTETGAINKIESWEQLSDAFTKLEAIYQEQEQKKEIFIENWLYKFDGESTTRLKNILLSAIS